MISFHLVAPYDGIALSGEVQTRKGLWWTPRDPKTRKGMVTDKIFGELKMSMDLEIPE
jgi:hypothetical protein